MRTTSGIAVFAGASSGLKDLGSGDGGACIAGGQHDRTNSDDYASAVNKPQDPVARISGSFALTATFCSSARSTASVSRIPLGHNPGQGSPLPEYFPPHTGNAGDFTQ